MRKFLILTTAIPALLIANSAVAQVEVSDARTTPIDSLTADEGSPSDIIILAAGSVLVGEGLAAVTLNSNNTITNQGTVGSANADNTIGILVTGVTTGAIVNSGTINLLEDFVSTDTDDDGDLDGPFAQGSGRVGILVEGSSVFTGNIINGVAGRIDVEGNDSAGILVAGTLNGNLESSGIIQLVGDRSHGISVTGTINGDITISGAISAQGEGSSGVRVSGDVNGAISNTGNINATGFRSSLRTNAAARENLDADDLLVGGSALAVGANVSGGIVNDLVVIDEITFRGTLRSDGSAPALLVTASLDGVDNADVTIGAVGLAVDEENFGIINRGDITGFGLNDGFSPVGIRIEGTEVGGVLRQTTIEGGLLSEGSISVNAFEANATSISVGNGGIVPIIDIRGLTQATVISETGGRAATIVVEAGASVAEIRISGTIEASFIGTGVGGFATAIVDESGTVDLVHNTGRIGSIFTEVLSSGVESDPTDTTRRAIAVDLSANTTGAVLQQAQAVDDDPTDNFNPLAPEIIGDVLFGSGDDTLELAAGTINGDILFGDGADLLIIDNGAELTGALFDRDGQLVLDVRNGLLALGADTTLSLTSAVFGTDARLQLTIDPGVTGGSFQSATFNASGAVTFLQGARIAPILSGLIGDGGAFDLITAGSLSFGDTFEALLDTGSVPYLYNTSLSQNTVTNALVVTLSRRTATELGLDNNQASAYEAWFSAVSQSTDTALTGSFAGLTAADEFFSAYNQILPEFGAAAVQFTLANTDGTTGAVGNRLDAISRGYGPGGGIWLQEIGYYLDRDNSSTTQPYNGFGLGLAIGIDRPWGGFGALGLVLSGFSNQITQTDGFDTPLSSVSVQVGAYAGRTIGGFNFLTHSAIGLDSFDSERILQVGTVQRTSNADWSAFHLASTTRLSRDYQFGKWLFSPSVSIDFLRLSEEAYTETGGGIGLDLSIDRRVTENISATAAITAGRRFGSDASWWAPRLRAGVRNDLRGDGALTTARFAGFDERFTVRAEDLPSTAILFGFSLTAGSRYTSFGFDYDVDLRDGFTRHTGKVVIRFIF